MELVDNETFLSKLTTLFDQNNRNNKGTVWLTHKRYYHGIAEGGNADDDTEYPCLIRCTNGQMVYFSTRVQPGELHLFHSAYGSLLKASMSSLRKRDKKKEKLRAEEAATRKKKLYATIVVGGPKRGNGRNKRLRKLKAVLRQEELRKKIEAREMKLKST